MTHATAHLSPAVFTSAWIPSGDAPPASSADLLVDRRDPRALRRVSPRVPDSRPPDRVFPFGPLACLIREERDSGGTVPIAPAAAASACSIQRRARPGSPGTRSARRPPSAPLRLKCCSAVRGGAAWSLTPGRAGGQEPAALGDWCFCPRTTPLGFRHRVLARDVVVGSRRPEAHRHERATLGYNPGLSATTGARSMVTVCPTPFRCFSRQPLMRTGMTRMSGDLDRTLGSAEVTAGQRRFGPSWGGD